ncbi:hypothetical protein PsAD13_03791 [Pseudovibrio sp. Ad13]|nr:hypothetical protein PsAD13_03791 [Pseudovibrio sp. Ad13]
MNTFPCGNHRIDCSIQSCFSQVSNFHMRLPFLFLIPSLFIKPTLAENPPVQIIIDVSTTAPMSGTATVTLPAPQSLRLLKPRTIRGDAKTPPIQFFCDGIQKTSITYGKRLSCRELQWNVTFQNVQTAPHAIANQQNLYSPSEWWSLTEWDDIPRFEGILTIEICGKVHGKAQAIKCNALPTQNEPPLILTWGKSTKTLETGQTTLTLFKDDPTSALKAENLPAIQQQLAYLKALLAPEERTPNNIDLVWVAIDKKLGQIAGAAGKQAFLANFAVTDGAATDDSLAKLHWVSGHELFHLLTTQSYPLWISESLAQYYGYKSLEKAGLQSETPMEQWQNFQERYPHAATGLYEAHTKVTRDNNPNYYPLFYMKGAAFWQAVDQKLQKAGTSLDNVLPQIEAAAANDAALSSRTIGLLKTTLSEQVVSTLQQQYLH